MQNYHPHIATLLSKIHEVLPKLIRPSAFSVLLCKEPAATSICYGNDQVFLDAFFELFVCSQNGIPKIITKEATDVNYKFSDFHFEFDLSKETYTEQLEELKNLKRIKSISGKPHLIHVKGLNRSKCRLLHHFVDKLGDQIILFISVPSLQELDECIRSRGVSINLSFEKTALQMYCHECGISVKQEDFDRAYSQARGNIIQILYRFGAPKTAMERQIISGLLDAEKSNSFLEAASKLRDLVYKVYHLTVPLNVISVGIINHFQGSSKLPLIVEASAKYEHLQTMTYKDIFIYERYFLEILHILQQKEVKEVISKAVSKTTEDVSGSTQVKKGRKKATATATPT